MNREEGKKRKFGNENRGRIFYFFILYIFLCDFFCRPYNVLNIKMFIKYIKGAFCKYLTHFFMRNLLMVFCFLMNCTISLFRYTNKAPPKPLAMLQTHKTKSNQVDLILQITFSLRGFLSVEVNIQTQSTP